EHEHSRAVRDRRFSLRLLLRRVLFRVRIDDLAVRTERLHVLFEVRPVLCFVAGRLVLRQQQRDRAALAAGRRAAARAAARRAAALAAAAAGGEPADAHYDGRDKRERTGGASVVHTSSSSRGWPWEKGFPRRRAANRWRV